MSLSGFTVIAMQAGVYPIDAILLFEYVEPVKLVSVSADKDVCPGGIR